MEPLPLFSMSTGINVSSSMLVVNCGSLSSHPRLSSFVSDRNHHWPSGSNVAAMFHAVSYIVVHCLLLGLISQSPILCRSVFDPSMQSDVRNDFQTLRCCLPGLGCFGQSSDDSMRADCVHSIASGVISVPSELQRSELSARRYILHLFIRWTSPLDRPNLQAALDAAHLYPQF